MQENTNPVNQAVKICKNGERVIKMNLYNPKISWLKISNTHMDFFEFTTTNRITSNEKVAYFIKNMLIEVINGMLVGTA